MADSLPKKPQLRKRAWQKKFLACLAECGNVAAICKEMNIDLSTCYKCRRTDPEFAKAWEEAEELALDHLEVVAKTRAAGMSDRLLEWMLARRRPAKWAEEKTEQPGGGANVNINIS